MAVFYSLYVSVVYLFRGPRPFEGLGITFVGAVVLYFAGRAFAGAVVGVLWPLTRRRAGAGIVAGVAAFIVYGLAGTFTSGAPLRWGHVDWITTTILGVVWTIAGAFYFYQAPDPVVPAPLPSHLHTVWPDGHRDPEA